MRASTTRNGKLAAMRLHSEVVEALVFNHLPRIEPFQRDLKESGVSYRDASSRLTDFHSLRKTFCTNLAKAGVPSRVAMTLMRHMTGGSRIKFTGTEIFSPRGRRFMLCRIPQPHKEHHKNSPRSVETGHRLSQQVTGKETKKPL